MWFHVLLGTGVEVVELVFIFMSLKQIGRGK